MPGYGLFGYFQPWLVGSAAGGDLEASVITALRTDATIQAVCGQNVFGGPLAQSVQDPGLSVRLISRRQEMMMDGPTGVVRAVVRITPLSLAQSDLKRVRKAIFSLLGGFSGALAGGVTVLEATQLNDLDDLSAPAAGSESFTFSEPLDFLFRYRE